MADLNCQEQDFIKLWLKFKKLRHVTEDIFYNVLRIKVELNKKK